MIMVMVLCFDTNGTTNIIRQNHAILCITSDNWKELAVQSKWIFFLFSCPWAVRQCTENYVTLFGCRSHISLTALPPTYVTIYDFAVRKRSPLLPLLARSTSLEVTTTTNLMNEFQPRRSFPALILTLQYLSWTWLPTDEEYLRKILGLFCISCTSVAFD
jgi:hypothetical protein